MHFGICCHLFGKIVSYISVCVCELVPWDSRRPAMKSYRLSAWFLCPFQWWRGRCTRGCYRSWRGSLERGEHLRVPVMKLHTQLGQQMRKSGLKSQLFFCMNLKQSEYLDWRVRNPSNPASCGGEHKKYAFHKQRFTLFCNRFVMRCTH